MNAPARIPVPARGYGRAAAVHLLGVAAHEERTNPDAYPALCRAAYAAERATAYYAEVANRRLGADALRATGAAYAEAGRHAEAARAAYRCGAYREHTVAERANAAVAAAAQAGRAYLAARRAAQG